MKTQKFNTTTIMEPWYNKKRMWQCQWILSAMAYQRNALFLIIEAPLWSPMSAIPLFWTHEALITSHTTSFYLHGTFYHQHAGSLLILCQTFEAQKFCQGKVWTAGNSFLREVTSHNQEGSVRGAMRRTCLKDVRRTGDSVHKYMFVSKCSI